jgi:hypothetical protein
MGLAPAGFGETALSRKLVSISVSVFTEEDSVIEGVLTLMIGSDVLLLPSFKFMPDFEVPADTGLMEFAGTFVLYASKAGALVFWCAAGSVPSGEVLDGLVLEECSLSRRSGLIPKSPVATSYMLTGREEGGLELVTLDLDRLRELKGFFKSPVRVSAADLLRRNC